MNILKYFGMALSAGVLGLGCFLAWTPWRAHGGRFATEYLLLGGTVGVLGLIGLVLSARSGG